VNIDEKNLLKRKQGLECLMNIFGMENVRYYYKIAFFVPIGVGGTLVLGTLVGFGLTSTLTVATGVGAAIGILVIAGLAGYFIYRHIKNKHQDKLKENAKMLEDFYDKVLGFLSSGVDYFCENKGNIISPKNLFVIAYEKDRNDLINDICLFPYYISRLDSINCPTIGPNAPNCLIHSWNVSTESNSPSKYALKITAVTPIHNKINRIVTICFHFIFLSPSIIFIILIIIS